MADTSTYAWNPKDFRITADYHTHTIYSHGHGTVYENVRAAAGLGLSEVAIADHGPANLFGVGIRTPETLNAIAQDVLAAGRAFPEIKVMSGVEANIISADGDLDVPEGILSGLDIVLAGLHWLVRAATPRDMLIIIAGNAISRHLGFGSRRMLDYNTWAVANAVRRHRIDIVTHPGLRLPVDTKTLARACAERGTLMEINASHDHTTPRYLRVAEEENAQFVLSSDAHSPSAVGLVDRALRLAARSGIDPARVVNLAPA